MLTEIKHIPNGVYIVWKDGSGWMAFIWDDGLCIDSIEQWEKSLHDAANDKWAGFSPSEVNAEYIEETLHNTICEVLELDPYKTIIERVIDEA